MFFVEMHMRIMGRLAMKSKLQGTLKIQDSIRCIQVCVKIHPGWGHPDP